MTVVSTNSIIPQVEIVTPYSRNYEKSFEESKDLIFSSCGNVIRYTSEELIARYQCNDKAYYLEPRDSLNNFVKRITVSTAKAISFWVPYYMRESSVIRVEQPKRESIVYYEDNVGVLHKIIQGDISHFLLKQPKLTVSPEGMLIFYTKDEVLATLDCEHYCWLHSQELCMEGRSIEIIKAYDNFCRILVFDRANIAHNFKLTFDFDFIAKPMIHPEIVECKS